jgi:uncharacterized protein (DUF305 family)
MKNSRTKSFYLGFGIVFIVAAVVISVVALTQGGEQLNTTTTTSSNAKVDYTKSDTEKNYETYVGEDYDRYYIANMMAHHEGAVDMAKLALTSAKHQELKDMANEIVTAQTKEINNMMAWQKAWNYPSSSGEMMEDHSAMGMMGEMENMTEALKGLSGDEFDKKFIELMIEHHASAVAMSKPGLKNAYHQEVKDLVKAVIDTQSKEIEQMKTWQQQWGYKS